MNTFIQIGTTVVLFALLFYSIAILYEQRTHRAGKKVLLFLTGGVIFDVTATVFMILGSSQQGLTLHGLIGYSSLAAMAIDAFLIWRLRLKEGCNAQVPKSLHLYSRYAYFWWVAAFITGGILVALR